MERRWSDFIVLYMFMSFPIWLQIAAVHWGWFK